jgi:hypothetical protein
MHAPPHHDDFTLARALVLVLMVVLSWLFVIGVAVGIARVFENWPQWCAGNG